MLPCKRVIKMNAYEKIEKLKDKEFKMITGVTREVFEKMLEVLREEYAKEHMGGGQPGLPAEVRLTLTAPIINGISGIIIMTLILTKNIYVCIIGL